MLLINTKVRKVNRLLINNKSMVPSTCKLEVQKTNERKITWVYGQKTSFRIRCSLREVPGLWGYPLRVREGYHDAPCMTTIRKPPFDKWDAYNLDTE